MLVSLAIKDREPLDFRYRMQRRLRYWFDRYAILRSVMQDLA